MEIKFIDSNNGYRLRFVDNVPPDIDLNNIVQTSNGFWAKLEGEHYELGSKVYYSKNKRDWVPAYAQKKNVSPNMKSPEKVQEGKIIYRTDGRRANGWGYKSIGRNILTWYTGNKVKKVREDLQIDHIDGDFTNDHLHNLERVSPSENIKRRNALMNGE